MRPTKSKALGRPGQQGDAASQLVARHQSVCFRDIRQRQRAVEGRSQPPGLHLFERPPQVLDIASERTANLLLAEEEVANVEGDLCAAHEADGHDNA